MQSLEIGADCIVARIRSTRLRLLPAFQRFLSAFLRFDFGGMVKTLLNSCNDRSTHSSSFAGNAGMDPIHENDVTFESIFTLKCGRGLKLLAYIVHGELRTFTASLIYHTKVLNEYVTMLQQSYTYDIQNQRYKRLKILEVHAWLHYSRRCRQMVLN